MKFECPSCKMSGQVDDSKVHELGMYATCPQCNNKFLIKRETPKDFTFEPIQESVKIEEPPPVTKQEPKQKNDNSVSRRQLYRAAIGKNIDYYLPIFERFDRDGKTSASWNWAAFTGGWIWCWYRRMNLIGISLFLFILLLSVIGKVGDVAALVDGLISVTSIIIFGIYANAFYYNQLNKKIGKLNTTLNGNNQLELLIKQCKPSKVILYVFAGFLGLAIIGVIAAIAIPQYSIYKEKASENIVVSAQQDSNSTQTDQQSQLKQRPNQSTQQNTPNYTPIQQEKQQSDIFEETIPDLRWIIIYESNDFIQYASYIIKGTDRTDIAWYFQKRESKIPKMIKVGTTVTLYQVKCSSMTQTKIDDYVETSFQSGKYIKTTNVNHSTDLTEPRPDTYKTNIISNACRSQ